jgi:hypothetical protein
MSSSVELLVRTLCSLSRTDFRAPRLEVSGLLDDDVISTWTGEVGSDLFPKPFKSDPLVEKVKQVLGG